MASLPSTSCIPDRGDTPDLSFPKRDYGKKTVVKRSFQYQWFSRWKWIHYDIDSDKAYCHTCIRAVKTKKLRDIGTGELAFISRGYCN